jgi:hypothetical protein
MTENCTGKTTEGGSTPQYKKKIFYAHWLPESYFPNYNLLKIRGNVQSVHFELITQQVAHLYPDYLTARKIPGVVRIISNPFYIRCCSRTWMSLASVAKTVDFRSPQR